MVRSSMRFVPLEFIAAHPAHRAARILSRCSCLPCPKRRNRPDSAPAGAAILTRAGAACNRKWSGECAAKSRRTQTLARIFTASQRLRESAAHHLQRTFRKAMGITPRQYADAIRVARLKSDLRKGIDVTTALYEAGYGSTSRLYERSDAQLGMTPATYRRGGRGMKISYTISDCSLGRVLVAATERGISAVSLGDNDAQLGGGTSQGISARRDSARREQDLPVGARDRPAPRRIAAPARLADRRGGNRVPAARVGDVASLFRPARRAPTAKWRGSLGQPARREPWRAHAPQIPLRSWFHVIE